MFMTSGPRVGIRSKEPLSPSWVHQIDGLPDHGRDILGHLLALETRHQNGPLFQVFLKLGKEVEPLVEHLDEERVALPNRQQFIGFGEKEAVVFGSQEDDRRLVAEP